MAKIPYLYAENTAQLNWVVIMRLFHCFQMSFMERFVEGQSFRRKIMAVALVETWRFQRQLLQFLSRLMVEAVNKYARSRNFSFLDRKVVSVRIFCDISSHFQNLKYFCSRDVQFPLKYPEISIVFYKSLP